MAHSHTGQKAENLAITYLKRAGKLRLVTRNYRCRAGEIDLVMADESLLVFIEVKFRKGETFAPALEAVTAAKKRRLRITAGYFLAKHANRYDKHLCRFDVLAISGSIDRPNYQWIQGAFEEKPF